MVRSLSDTCLSCIEKQLAVIKGLRTKLPTYYKELLLERLCHHDLFSDDYLPYITYGLFCDSLRHVSLSRCSQVTDRCLLRLAEARCLLEVLKIDRCEKVTDAGILAVTTGQTELRTLELVHLPHLTAKGLFQVSSTKLQRLNLKGCSSMTTEGVVSVCRKNPLIKYLKLVDCPKIDSTVVPAVATSLGESLEEILADFKTTTEESISYLAQHCPNLAKMNLCGCTNIGKAELIKLVQGCTKLKSLDLSYCNRLCKMPESEALWVLPQSLSELSLCGLLVEDENVFVECIQRLNTLRSLRVCGVAALNDKTLQQILHYVGENLLDLDISGGAFANLTDEGLKAIAQYCVNLQKLSLSMLRDVTCVTLTPLLEDSRASQITELHLSNKNIDLGVLFKVAEGCHNIEVLDLAGLVIVTDQLLHTVACNCPHLHKLSIKGCRQVTDTGVCELAQCCPLHSLNMSGIGTLTDKCIFTLANSKPYLEEIYLNGCAHISPVAVAYLTDCCVNRLYVQHRTPNAVPNQLMAKNLDTGEFCRADLLPSS
ncbi:F-box/LRR-repeat protein 2-like [Gigantopelta aegis]|uniref:F-box/LRR-repeat protein 2-like n=1 Tax=Gigantopelta aegis TaxID=1735272 RepID=UPI001B88C1D3|nr:F-box/LRR-repeat protein 2-like [Gigantopelta aegis]